MTCPFCGAEVGHATVCPQCGANVTVPSISRSLSLPAGTKLSSGKYSVGKVLGQGGFGITYMGADTTLARPVAIKEFFPEGCQRNGTTVQPTRIPPSDFASMKQKFLEEARLLASLNHPGIVKVYDFFEANNTAYMVMEYLRGRSLAKVVEERGGALGEQEAVGYILKVCEALDVVHKAGYLHRDIKPENIIVCEDGRVILVDFGAARGYMAGRTGRMTVILTPGFAPLEQYAEQAQRGAYTDIYALGATLYYLLTGQVPVSAADRFSGVELKGVREINGRVSRQVEEAVRKAMAMRVDERPQSVEEFVQLLTSPSVGVATSSVGVSAAPKVSVPSVVKGVWREVVTLRGHQGWVSSVSFSPDGKFLASGSEDATVKVWDVGSWREVATLRGHQGWVFSVSFSPDGKFLASGDLDNTVKVWDVGSWREVATLEGHGDEVWSVTFSPDGKFLASGSLDNTVKVWAVGSWREVATLEGHGDEVNIWKVMKWQKVASLGHERGVTSVTFSPDGGTLVSGGFDGTMKFWKVGSWQARVPFAMRWHEDEVRCVTFSPDRKFLASGSADKTVNVLIAGFSERSGSISASIRKVATLMHANSVYSVTFNPGGEFLVSGSADDTVKVWAVGSWREVATLRGHQDWVSSVSFSPDGKFLASGSGDKTVKVWEVGG
jgi:WD40 repeat protein/predicted Ser/Thr protein kinase